MIKVGEINDSYFHSIFLFGAIVLWGGLAVTLTIGIKGGNKK